MHRRAAHERSFLHLTAQDASIEGGRMARQSVATRNQRFPPENSQAEAPVREHPPQHVWHSLPVETVLHTFDVSSTRGLSDEDAIRRLSQYGANELREQPRLGFWQRLLHQFQS